MSALSPGTPSITGRGRRSLRGAYGAIVLLTVVPAGLILAFWQATPLVAVGVIWLVGAVAVTVLRSLPVWVKTVAVLGVPVCTVAWRLVNYLQGSWTCQSSTEHPVDVCTGGHPALRHVYDAMPMIAVTVLLALAVVLVVPCRARAASLDARRTPPLPR